MNIDFLRKLSLHPRLVGVADIILNVVIILAIEFASSWWLILTYFIARQLLWLVIIKFSYYPIETIRWRHFLSLFIFSFGFVFVLLFIEVQFVRYVVSAIYTILVFISFWFLPRSKVELAIFFKPHTRWRFIMTAMGLSGIFIGTHAIILFKMFAGVANWWWLIISSIVAVLISAWWWWEYNIKMDSRFYLTALIYLLLFVEFSFVLYKLPFGHLINGIILIWAWYLLWLFTRFNLSTQGIKWKKQIKFLIFNLSLFLFFLIFLVRWR